MASIAQSGRSVSHPAPPLFSTEERRTASNLSVALETAGMQSHMRSKRDLVCVVSPGLRLARRIDGRLSPSIVLVEYKSHLQPEAAPLCPSVPEHHVDICKMDF